MPQILAEGEAQIFVFEKFLLIVMIAKKFVFTKVFFYEKIEFFDLAVLSFDGWSPSVFGA